MMPTLSFWFSFLCVILVSLWDIVFIYFLLPFLTYPSNRVPLRTRISTAFVVGHLLTSFVVALSSAFVVSTPSAECYDLCRATPSIAAQWALHFSALADAVSLKIAFTNPPLLTYRTRFLIPVLTHRAGFWHLRR